MERIPLIDATQAAVSSLGPIPPPRLDLPLKGHLMFMISVTFLIYWLVFFVSNLTAIEVGHDQLYDEVPPYSALRAAGGSALLALLASWLWPSFETMFTNDIAWTVLQAIAWFLVFLFAYQFHPWHALGISLVTMVLVSGLATLGVDSMTKPRAAVAPIRASGAPPVRAPLRAPALPEKGTAAPK